MSLPCLFATTNSPAISCSRGTWRTVHSSPKEKLAVFLTCTKNTKARKYENAMKDRKERLRSRVSACIRCDATKRWIFQASGIVSVPCETRVVTLQMLKLLQKLSMLSRKMPRLIVAPGTRNYLVLCSIFIRDYLHSLYFFFFIFIKKQVIIFVYQIGFNTI